MLHQNAGLKAWWCKIDRDMGGMFCHPVAGGENHHEESSALEGEGLRTGARCSTNLRSRSNHGHNLPGTDATALPNRRMAASRFLCFQVAQVPAIEGEGCWNLS